MVTNSSPESGPSRRRLTTTTLRLPDPTAKARVKRIWRNITERPSLLSSSSDSNHTGSQYEPNNNPDGDPRLYAESRRRSRGRHRHMLESRIPDGEVGYYIKRSPMMIPGRYEVHAHHSRRPNRITTESYTRLRMLVIFPGSPGSLRTWGTFSV
jgi:hypothetical protein